jgi:hypothetical protein
MEEIVSCCRRRALADLEPMFVEKIIPESGQRLLCEPANWEKVLKMLPGASALTCLPYFGRVVYDCATLQIFSCPREAPTEVGKRWQT